MIEEWLVNSGAPNAQGTLVAEYIWGAPAPNGLLSQRRTADHPRALADAQAHGHSDLSALPEADNGLWTYPVLDSRGNLRAVVSGSGVGSGSTAYHGGADDGPIVLERRAITATGLPVVVQSYNGSLTGFESIDSAPIPIPSIYSSALLTGHHWDSYSQWHYARHRWISPWTYGRFTSHSPLTYPVAELNYEWVNRNPWEWVDPDGLLPEEPAIMDHHWHHLIPQEFKDYAKRAGININDIPNGVYMDRVDHKNLHSLGWNDEWNKFFENNPNATKCEIEEFLKKMMGKTKYRKILARATKVSFTFSQWKKLRDKANTLLGAGWTRVGNKIIPLTAFVGVLNLTFNGEINEANAALWNSTAIGMVHAETGSFPSYLDYLTEMETLERVQGGLGGWNEEIGYIPWTGYWWNSNNDD